MHTYFIKTKDRDDIQFKKTIIKLYKPHLYELYVPDVSYISLERGSFLSENFIRDNKAIILSLRRNPTNVVGNLENYGNSKIQRRT